MEFLRKIEDRGYPADYLLSRIKGRRAHLITDWKPFLSGASPVDRFASTRYGVMTDDYPENIRRYLLKEFGWVYSRMDRYLREIFLPFFLYVELGTIFICLRFAKNEETVQIEKILSISLLSEKIKKILRGGGHLPSIIEALDECFTSLSVRFGGLGKTLEEAGLPAVELALATRYLEYVVHSQLHPAIKDFFVTIVDSRNILSLHKCIRLKVTPPPPFISGGKLSEKIFKKIAAARDLAGTVSLVRRITGTEPGTTNMETLLYRMVTRLLRKAGRDPLGVGLILDYLWRCSIEATNLSIIYYGSEVGAGIIAEEAVV